RARQNDLRAGPPAASLFQCEVEKAFAVNPRVPGVIIVLTEAVAGHLTHVPLITAERQRPPWWRRVLAGPWNSGDRHDRITAIGQRVDGGRRSIVRIDK